jgi:amidohydrolase
MNRYLKSAQDNFKQIRNHRRDFHKHAEIGFSETRTAGKIAAYLRTLGLDVSTGIAKTGVVGLLRCREGGKTAALRADIDALPMEDKKDVPYASVNPGAAHACGHDGHAAILMETARLLTENAEHLQGNVKFIFQPCEDMIPSGAEPMIEAGVLDNPGVDGIFTLHVSTSHELGTLWVKREYISISSAGFELTLKGKGGHVSQPHRGIDPINMAGLLITGSQTLMLKSTQPGKPIVFAFGTIHGGTADNIIPDSVSLSGTIRTATPEDRKKGIEDFERIVKGIADAAGGSYQLEIELQNPSMYNAPEMVDLLKAAADKVIGAEKVNEFHQIMPGGDDAAFFQQKVPGVYWILGARNEAKGYIQPGHSPFFDFDEDALPIGAAVQAQAVTDFLSLS